MYVLALFLMIFFHPFTYAVSTFGMTSGCPQDGALLANEGDPFVIVKLNGKEWILYSESGKKFSLQAKEPVTFRSKNNDPMKGEPTLEFEMTSMVMNSLPRLVVSYSGVQNKCRVEHHESRDKKQN
jgi:hypothetical protein